MNRAFNSLACIGLVFFGAHAIADEPMNRTTPTKRQTLNDCMEKHKAADVSMSKAELKRICKDQLKQQKSTGGFADPPPRDTPRN